jgi:hypothetical protein
MIKGKVTFIGQTQQVSDKFAKRELVVTTSDQYPQVILIEFQQDKCSLLDNVQLGSEVDVEYNIRGRAWTNPEGVTKYFNTIQGWKIEVSNPTMTDTRIPLADLVPKDDMAF